MKPVWQRPQAGADIASIADFLRGKSLSSACRFIEEIEAAYALQADHPCSGSARHAELLPELPAQLRFHPVRHFERILIYYMDLDDRVEVLRVWDATRGLEALIDDTGMTDRSIAQRAKKK